MPPNDPVEAISSTLVAALFPALELAMERERITYGATLDMVGAAAAPVWIAEHGSDIARRAGEILRQVGPAAIHTPYGREIWFREHPLAVIQTPREAIRTPRKAIGRRFYRSIVRFCTPPASKA